MNNKKKQIEPCPYKEHWFGETLEAQEKPAGFKFKRGSLLKIKNKGYLDNYSYDAGGFSKFLPYGRRVTVPTGFGEQTIVLIFDYNSEIDKTRVWNEVMGHNVWIDTVKHTFTFLFNERWGTLVLEVWGTAVTRNFQNEMWMKARKPRKLPQKKRKTFKGGFSFDDLSEDSE